VRCVQAQRLLDALQRYADWVQAQRFTDGFEGESAEAAAALNEACTIRLRFFPELAADMAQLLAVHKRLMHFLETQQALWLRDPAQWLASDHDTRFLALWRQHRYCVKAVLTRIEEVTSVQIRRVPARRESTYA
jgi:hypothetical protein